MSKDKRSTAISANPFDGLAERLDRVLVTDRNGERFVLSTESAKNLAKTAETWVQSHAIIDTSAATPTQSAASTDAVREAAEALCLLAAYDDRLQKLHDLLETIREQIRIGVEPEHRPKGLFQNIQDAVYAMRGRTLLMNDAAITGPLQAIADPRNDRGGAQS